MTHVRFTAAVAAAFTLALGGPALAESNNLAAVEAPPLARVLQGGGVTAGTGSEAYSAFASNRSTAVVAGTDLLVPTDGGDGSAQTADSLPPGAMEGTVAYAQAQSVARYFAERDGRTRLATRRPADVSRG